MGVLLFMALGFALVPVAFAVLPPLPPPFRVMLYLRLDAVWAWLAFSGMLAAFAAAMLVAHRLALPAPALIAFQAGFGAAIALFPAMPSSDPIAYRFAAQQLLAGADPWARTIVTATQLHDPYAAAMVQLYGNPPVASIYGPAFVALEAAFVRLTAGLSPVGWLIAQRLAALAAFVAITPLVPPRRRALWALNPFLLFEFALSAHNDVFMLLGLALALRFRHSPWSGLGVAFAGLVKLVGFFGLGLLRRRAVLVALVASAAVLVAVPAALTLGPAAAQATLVPYSAVVTPLLAHAGLLAAVPVARLLVFAAVAFALWRQPWYRRDRPVYAAILVVAAVPVVHPWYATWPLLFAQWGSRRAMRWAFGVAAAAWLLYLADWA
jgi:hypothetical protein